MRYQAIRWNVERKARRWTSEEFEERLAVAPEKIEFVGGIFVGDEQRHLVLGMLLENLGMEAALKFGRIDDWEAAIAARRTEVRK
jgi:hypothetical protein